MNSLKSLALHLVGATGVWLLCSVFAFAQIAPSGSDREAYRGLHKAAHDGDVETVRRLAGAGADLKARDGAMRTPLHVAAYASQDGVIAALAEAGADLNALEFQDYDIVTIAAVADDVELLDLALSLGANSENVTSPYEGTALIAASHLGHYQIVKSLIAAGAPLDHVNNLGWTALIEVVVLGDGGPDHLKTARALVDAGADRKIGDRSGITPLEHARARGYTEMISVLKRSTP